MEYSKGSSNISQAQSHYSSRAANYDNANGGWHIKLGQEFADWLSPIPTGGTALDIACGTGLVTIPLAKAIGRDGIVVGVDITTDMLNQARQKNTIEDAANIIWIEHDISNLDDVEEVQTVVKDRGGFDAISCCSALVLLHSPAEAIKSWSTLLKPGGRMIIDVPTEDKTLQYIMSSDPKLRAAMSAPNFFDRTWIENVHSLEKLYQDAGLAVEKSWRTISYLPEDMYEKEDGDKVWEEQLEKYRGFIEVSESGRAEAKQRFLEIWRDTLNEDGKFVDGHWLYVSIARRE